jgi:excisionase family DNA binding protein
MLLTYQLYVHSHSSLESGVTALVSRLRRGLTLQEAARLIQFHHETVRYWLRVGELRGTRTPAGDDWTIELEDLLVFLRANGEIPPWSMPTSGADEVVAGTVSAR